MRTWAEQQETERRSRVRWLRQLSATGMILTDCARAAGIDRTQLAKMSKLHRVRFSTTTGKPKIALTEALVRECVDKDMTVGEAVQHIGCSRQGLRSAARRYGIELRDGRFVEVPPPPPVPVREPTQLEKLHASAAESNRRMRAHGRQ